MAKSGYNPTTKAIHTESGTKILLNDAEGSVRIEDASGSTFTLNGKGKISLNSSIFEVNTQQMLINATQSMQITTGDYMLNALNRIYVFSNWMKQQVNGFMQLFSNKALINSTQTLALEAKEAKVSGSETALLYSEKEAVVNSMGTAKLRGKQGNEYTNKAEMVSHSEQEFISNVIVKFRPDDLWQGEFGLDWMRIDEPYKLEEPYSDTIISGYQQSIGGLSNLGYRTRDEAFSALEREYEQITIKRKDGNLEKYYVPWLNIFPECATNTIPIEHRPPSAITLKVFVDIEGYEVVDEKIATELDENGNEDENVYTKLVPPEQIRIVFDKDYFEIDGKDGSDENPVLLSINGDIGQDLVGTMIDIKCINDFVSQKEIIVYSYPPGTLSKTSNEQKIERKIAGKIIVCPNSNGLEDTITHQIVNHRKELNVVLVQVKTKPDGVIIFNNNELMNVRKYLSQGLINVTFIDGDIMSINGREEKKPFELNVSRDNRFITGGRNSYINSGGKLIGEPHPILKELFNAQTNNTYANDFIVFAFDIEGENYRGNAESIGGRTLIVTSDRDSVTLSHELLHCLGLYHTHQDFKIIINRNTPNSSTVFKPNKRNNSGCLYVSKTDGSLWLYKNRRYINYDPYLFEEQIKQNKKYIFNHGNIKQRLSTYNIMSYNSIRFYLWRWQWEIINKNII